MITCIDLGGAAVAADALLRLVVDAAPGVLRSGGVTRELVSQRHDDEWTSVWTAPPKHHIT